MTKKTLFLSTLTLCCAIVQNANACTGITLKSGDNATIVARTMDWSGSENNSMYTIVPRGHNQQSILPDGTKDGLSFVSLYGYAGLAVEEPEFIIDGTNEAGLSAALFYFPNYGEYQKYNDKEKTYHWLISRLYHGYWRALPPSTRSNPQSMIYA